MIDFTGRHFAKLLILQAIRWVVKNSKELESVFSNNFRKYGSYLSLEDG
ncbi:hypothetical protein [Francisella philomiragia]